jgi:hypothetical protein
LSDLNPAQQRVADGLLDLRGVTPRIDPAGVEAIKRDLNRRLQFAVDALDQAGQTLRLNKNAITTVLSCETRWRDGNIFSWSVPNAIGTIAHRAAELVLVGRHPGPAADAVDGATVLISDDNSGFAEFVDAASAAERAAIRAGAVAHVTSLIDGFPPLPKRVFARTEQSFNAVFGQRTIELTARPDLALGRPAGADARSLLVDLKTGRPHQSHADDLRFYALVFALRWGAAPWRVASFYAPDGTWSAEDVDADVLDAAARRVSDAVLRMTEMNVSNRPPGLTAGVMCKWCGLETTCEAAATWAQQTADEDDLSYGDDDDTAF